MASAPEKSRHRTHRKHAAP